MRKLAAFIIFLLLCIPALAGDDIPTISQSQLDTWAHFWGHTLSLDDWTVRISFVALGDLPDGTWGQSRTDPRIKEVRIRVLRPADYPAAAAAMEVPPLHGAAITHDIEDTVIHELIHLRLSELMRAGEQDLRLAEEVAVDRITKALLRTRYAWARE